METEQRDQIINEIRRLEREVYQKKSHIAAAEALEYEATLRVAEKLDADEWGKELSKLIEQIGTLSTGGNSVEDIRIERQR